MTAFEKFLVDRGYKKYRYIVKENNYVLEKERKHEISTMTNIDYRYVIEDDFSNQIVFGLHKSEMPPTLIFPRPLIRVKDDNMYLLSSRDIYMNRVLEEYGFEEILNYMFDKTKFFIIDDA